MNYLNLYVKFIFAIKIIFISLAVYKVYITHKHPKNTKKIEEIQYWKDRCEIFFKGTMAVLLIVLFNPRTSKEVMKLDYETRLLLYLFGFILLITADWKSIFKKIPESLELIQKILPFGKG
jgi:uncharacterized membrane protein